MRSHAQRKTCPVDGCAFTYLPHCTINFDDHVLSVHNGDIDAMASEKSADHCDSPSESPSVILKRIHEILQLDMPDQFTFRGDIADIDRNRFRLVLL